MRKLFRLCILLLFIFLSISGAHSQPKTHVLMAQLVTENPHPVFQEVVRHPENYRLQIIYTQIDRDKNNKPSFKNFYFNLDSTLYFNPASIVKLPLAVLSLERINQ